MSKVLTREGQDFKVDQLGRVRIGHKRREELLVEFDRSGMSGKQFARSVGVNYSTWASWVQRRRRTKALIVEGRDTPGTQSVVMPQPMEWVEAHLDSTPSPRSGLVVHGPNGIKLEIQDETQARLAGVLLKGLC
jgi:hypothetical protein